MAAILLFSLDTGSANWNDGREVCARLGAPTTTMATSLPPVDSKQVVRCDQCSLVQFESRDQHCRRCRLPYDYGEPAPPAPEPAPALVAARDLSAELAATIRTLRHKLGLSQRELAARLRVPRTYASKIENLRCTPTLGTLERIARALETTIPDLLGDCDRIREQRIAELMKDEFVAALMADVSKLSEMQMRQILATVHEMVGRPRRAA